MSVFWLSFCDSTGFLGACLIKADTEIEAVEMSHDKKCNPGGECSITELDPTDPQVEKEIKKWGLAQLITHKELAETGEYVNAKTGETLTIH